MGNIFCNCKTPQQVEQFKKEHPVHQFLNHERNNSSSSYNSASSSRAIFEGNGPRKSLQGFEP